MTRLAAESEPAASDNSSPSIKLNQAGCGFAQGSCGFYSPLTAARVASGSLLENSPSSPSRTSL